MPIQTCVDEFVHLHHDGCQYVHLGTSLCLEGLICHFPFRLILKVDTLMDVEVHRMCILIKTYHILFNTTYSCSLVLLQQLRYDQTIVFINAFPTGCSSPLEITS